MILELTAKTSVDDATVEFIQVTTKQGESISLNWETSYLTRDSKGFSARHVAVCFGEDYANGKLETLRNMTIDVNMGSVMNYVACPQCGETKLSQ